CSNRMTISHPCGDQSCGNWVYWNYGCKHRESDMNLITQPRHGRMARRQSPSYEQLSAANRREDVTDVPQNVVIQCGWGRFIVGHTFKSDEALAQAVLDEASGERDIALYVSRPHVVLSHAPQRLFL